MAGSGRWLQKSYLASYNLAQAFGWALVLWRILAEGRPSDAYTTAGHLVRTLQLAAFLEVVHSVVGLVSSSPITCFLQWAGRSHVLLAVISQLPEVQGLPAVFIIFAAWSLSEVIRYPQYALHTFGSSPRWLTWLRYSAFIVLYPIGVLAEGVVMYSALPDIKKTNLYHSIFKALPFSYHTFVIGLLCAYPFLWLLLYVHMIQQRRAKVSRPPARRKPTRRNVKKATS